MQQTESFNPHSTVLIDRVTRRLMRAEDGSNATVRTSEDRFPLVARPRQETPLNQRILQQSFISTHLCYQDWLICQPDLRDTLRYTDREEQNMT